MHERVSRTPQEEQFNDEISVVDTAYWFHTPPSARAGAGRGARASAGRGALPGGGRRGARLQRVPPFPHAPAPTTRPATHPTPPPPPGRARAPRA
jgi:hypothetical protein